MQNINKKLGFLLLFLIFGTGTLFASGTGEKVDVIATIGSGSYDKMLKVDLKATDPNAKIYYTFDPNGNPNDLMLYTGSITIKSSTPLVFWTYVSLDNESKIKILDYKIRYPNDVILGSGAVYDKDLKNVTLSNTSSAPIDISFWEARNDSGSVIIPEGTIIQPGERYEIKGLNGTGTVSLFAPDKEKKDFVDIAEMSNYIVKADPKTLIRSAYNIRKTTAIRKSKPSVAYMVPKETAQPDKTETTVTETGKSETVTGNSTEQPSFLSSAKEETIKETGNDFNNRIKAGVQESGTSSKALPFIIMGIAIFAGVGLNYARARRK